MIKKQNKNEIGRVGLNKFAIILIILLLLGAALCLLKAWETQHSDYSEELETLDPTITYYGDQYILKDNIETFLLLGLDKFASKNAESYNNDKQADFLLLLVVDHSEDVCKIIHINRDTMTKMNVLGVAGDKINTVEKQIALSHTYGNGREVSCRNTANAVSNLLLGMEIDHYVSVTMDAVSAYNDFIGGVTLEVLDDFPGIDNTLIKGETVTLTGEQALNYVRSRYGLDDPTNVDRMRRQKQFLEAAYAKTQQCISEDSSFISRATIQMADYLISDCSGNKLEALLNDLIDYEIGTVLDIEGESVMGEEFMEFYPDEASVMKIVVECFYEMTN